MEYEKQPPAAQPNLYPVASTGESYPPPYAAFQNPPPGGVAYSQAYPQAYPQQPAYPQPYPPATSQQPYSSAGYAYTSTAPGPPGYGHPIQTSAGYGQPQQVVIMTEQPRPVVVSHPESVSMIGAIVLSCFVFWCCGLLCGLIAFILAMVGLSSASSGNAQGAIQLRNASYGVSIVGIVVGIICIILIFVLRH